MNFKSNIYLISMVLTAIIVASCTPIEYQPRSEGTSTLVCADGTVISCPVPEEEETEGEEMEGPSEEEETEGEPEEEMEGEPEEEEEETVEEKEPEDIPSEEEEVPEEEVELEGESADLTITEGELVELSTEAKDPDGDELTLTYSEPIGEDGTWQTEVGDAGTYEVTVTASDGKEEVSKTMTILVLSENAAPIIEIEDEIAVVEGETVSLEPTVTDADDEELEVSFSGWMETSTYETGYDDAGQYVVTISASDGKTTTTKDVIIMVENKNRKPTLEITNAEDGQIFAVEGEEIIIEVSTDDPDGDNVEVSFASPFNEEGSWQTSEGDADEHVIEVKATDGMDEVVQEVLIVIETKNMPPTLEPIGDMYVSIEVGKTVEIKLEPVAEDPEGGEVTLTYSGWMEESTKSVDWGEEGGEHTVTVTATDEEGGQTSVDVKITVNSAPCFIGDCPE